MQYINLTQDKQAIVDDDDFEQINAFKWYFHRGRAIRSPAKINGKRKGFIWMHREIMKATEGQIIDHINNDALDNRKENLRFCTRSENQWNQKLSKRNTSGYKNIYWYKAKKVWRLHFTKFGKLHCFGYFKNIEDAIVARDEYAIKFHNGFNKPLA
jgi:hypothetical protein